MEVDTVESSNEYLNHLDISELIPDLKQKLTVCSKSLESDILNDENFTRTNTSESYKNQSFEFTSEYTNNRDFIQYSRTYFSRLLEIKQDLLRQASEKWRNFKVCENILDVRGKEVQVLCGVVYKEMPLKPSILKGMDVILGSKKVESFVNITEDYLVIEDQSGRIRVSNSSPMKHFSTGDFVTGAIISAKGQLDDRGLFLLEDSHYYQCNNYSLSRTLQIHNDSGNKSNIYNLINSNNNLVCLISGLQFGKVDYTGKLALARNLLLDIIQSRFNSDSQVNRLFRRINRVVIAGNSVNSPEDTDLVEKGSYLKQELNTRIYKTLLQNFDECDDYLHTLCHSVNIDIMPGTDDTSSSFFPQLPINSIMLPKSCNNSTVRMVTNPYKFEYENVNFLGTSGQNIDNIRKYTTIGPNPIDILEHTLTWSHISPSAPDTLRTYPVVEKDPLTVREIPNVYFTANQKLFETKLSHYNNMPVRLISVPDFSITFSIVLMDMITLETCEYGLEIYN